MTLPALAVTALELADGFVKLFFLYGFVLGIQYINTLLLTAVGPKEPEWSFVHTPSIANGFAIEIQDIAFKFNSPRNPNGVLSIHRALQMVS